MDDMTTDAPVDAGAESTIDAVPQTQAAPAAPQQPQGPDYSGLARYGDPETLQRQAEWMNGFYQKYSDPIKAQQFDKWYNDQQQQQGQHPYDWMNYDDERVAKLREYASNEQGQQNPEWMRHNAEVNNFMYNPLGQLSQYVTHPKIQEALYGSMAPQIQDLVQRALQPYQQQLQQQQQMQFRAQYEKPFMALPDSIKQLHQQGRFGQGNEGIINAIEAGKILAQQQAAAEGGGPAPTQPAVNKNNAVNKSPSAKKDDGDEDLKKAARDWEGARGSKK